MKQKIIPKFILFVISLLILLSCSGLTAKKQEPELPKMVSLGPMPVVINNPSSVIRHIWIFKGLDEVRLTRDPKTGKMAFDRAPIAEIKIDPCHNPENWHKYTIVYLPKNTSYRIYEQAERIIFEDPIGKPFSHSFRLDSNPYLRSYNPRTPSMSTTIPCAHFIELPHIDPSGPQHINPVITINPHNLFYGLINSVIKFIKGKEQ